MARRLLMLLAAPSLALLVAGPALAQYPPGSVLAVHCTPDTAAPGDTVSCTAGDCDPNSGVTVSDGQNLQTDSDGKVAFDTTIPDDAEGSFTISVTCNDGGEAAVLSAQVTVDDGLSTTGSNSGVLLGVGIGILVLGAGVLLFARRREGVTG